MLVNNDAVIEQACRELISEIPGLEIEALSIGTVYSQIKPQIAIECDSNSWSPTLMNQNCKWVACIDEPIAELSLEQAKKKINPYFLHQKNDQIRRSDIARNLGYSRPIAIEEITLENCKHIRFDQAVFDYLVAKNIENSRINVGQNIAELIKNLHKNVSSNKNTTTSTNSQILDKENGTIVVSGINTNMNAYVQVFHSRNEDCIIYFWDSMVMIENQNLPETMVASMVGRVIGDIIDIHPVMNQMEITQVIQDEITNRIGLVYRPNMKSIYDLAMKS